MKRALKLAARGKFTTSPNPAVGCVIVRNGMIIGEGYHHKAGEPHAEIMAMRSAGSSVAGATCYVTLEPCSHYGRTPPCAKALVKAGVKRVVIACGDPNPQVAGRGVKILKDAGVTKISIGIQSFGRKFQSVLGRKHINIATLKHALSEVPFETVSMDFIFALPNQTDGDLKEDIDTAFQNGANHVAIYPFIDFTFTPSTIHAMPKKEKRALLDSITAHCIKKGYTRTSIWTFSNDANARYSSMTRDNFLGFGCSATTLLKDQFKINTFSVKEYCQRISGDKLPTSLTIRFSLRQRMLYYLFWTAYSTKIDARDFEKFFGIPLKKAYGVELGLAKLLGLIVEDDGIYTMTPKGVFYYHHYENFHTLAYIDKMWKIMRKEAFPKEIRL